MLRNFIKSIIILLIFTTLLLPLTTKAGYLNQKVNFFIDSSYDLHSREEISAILQKITNHLYFYIDVNWWNKLDHSKKIEIDNKLYNLANEFEYKIYPILTQTFGSEPKPGIDKDERITILIHPMIEEAGGYFNSGNSYPKLQNQRSNEREMIYLNSQHIEKPVVKSFLAHEFMHLITFNQKEILRKVSEEIWLNEGRAEYISTLLGYDDIYEGSNLQKRIRFFLEKPNNSLIEWQNEKSDYGIVNLFVQYLVDHYGIKILVDSLYSSKIGIPSINEALVKNKFKEDFSQIFTNWLITLLVNDCSLGERYCYKNPNLKNLKIAPTINFLPFGAESTLSVFNTIKKWTGNWQKIVGGKGDLTFEFDGQNEIDFKVSYLICDYQEKCQINFLNLNNDQKGKMSISQFNTKYISLIIIPSIQVKISDFTNSEPSYSFIWKVSIIEKTKKEKEIELRKQLLAQIDFLKKEIIKLQTKILQRSTFCQKLENNLYLGIKNNSEVRCLQEFLKTQGPEIYPQGLVTGNFGLLTKLAVIRFQEKYALEILSPLGLKQGTGFVGTITRSKINQLILWKR